MNNPNPFVPQGSLLEQHKRRTRMKLAVFCVLALSVASLTAMLIEGCKRESENPPVDTNQVTSVDTNQQSIEASNPPVVVPPISTNPPVVVTPPMQPVNPPPQEATEGTTYVVVKGDTLGHIAKAHGVSLKEIEAANPNVQPTRLKIGDKLNIPASSADANMAPQINGGTDMSGAETYVVKSGDTLTKIAHSHGTTVKSLEAANNLSSTKIKVGKKLIIPASAQAGNPAATPPPPGPAPMSAPVQQPVTAAPAPAPSTNAQ
ncbi:MAG TPA: LysM peptidoglycan-binding domain-containing protein [Verrucomicrobiae bacterium]|jgi:LysM repeat protein